MNFVGCFGCAGFFVLFFVSFIFIVVFFPSKAQGLLQVRGRLASFTSFLAMRPFFAFMQKKFFNTGVRTGCHYLISLSVRLSVCVSVSVCVTFVLFTECESCTSPISTNPGSMEAGEYGLSCATCFLA